MTAAELHVQASGDEILDADTKTESGSLVGVTGTGDGGFSSKSDIRSTSTTHAIIGQFLDPANDDGSVGECADDCNAVSVCLAIESEGVKVDGVAPADMDGM